MMASTMGSTMGSTLSAWGAPCAVPRSPPKEEPDIDPMMHASMSMNTRWYPHVCTNRGTLKLTKPASLLQGVDPAKDHPHECAFFEGRKHRFAEVKSLPGGKPGTPTKSMKWKSELHWNDADNHHSLKVTHTLPKAMSSTTRSATLRGSGGFFKG